MKRIEKTGGKYKDLLKELKVICREKKIRNSELAEVFDMGQTTIADFGTFSEETMPYNELKELVILIKSGFTHISEADFRANTDINKLYDDIRKNLSNSKDTIRSIGKQVDISGTLLSNIKNGQYKRIPTRKTILKLCKGFGLKESDYITIKEKNIVDENNTNESTAPEKHSDIDLNTYGMFEEQISDIDIKDPEIKKLLEWALRHKNDKSKTLKLDFGSCIRKINYDKLIVLVQTIDILGATDTDFDFTIKTK